MRASGDELALAPQGFAARSCRLIERRDVMLDHYPRSWPKR
jgi:hypothetical protein